MDCTRCDGTGEGRGSEPGFCLDCRGGKRRLTITFGNMPERELFSAQFEEVCPEGFSFSNCKRASAGRMTERELWMAVKSAVRAWEDRADEEAASWASCVLCVLGIEWV